MSPFMKKLLPAVWSPRLSASALWPHRLPPRRSTAAAASMAVGSTVAASTAEAGVTAVAGTAVTVMGAVTVTGAVGVGAEPGSVLVSRLAPLRPRTITAVAMVIPAAIIAAAATTGILTTPIKLS